MVSCVVPRKMDHFTSGFSRYGTTPVFCLNRMPYDFDKACTRCPPFGRHQTLNDDTLAINLRALIQTKKGLTKGI